MNVKTMLVPIWFSKNSDREMVHKEFGPYGGNRCPDIPHNCTRTVGEWERIIRMLRDQYSIYQVPKMRQGWYRQVATYIERKVEEQIVEWGHWHDTKQQTQKEDSRQKKAAEDKPDKAQAQAQEQGGSMTSEEVNKIKRTAADPWPDQLTHEEAKIFWAALKKIGDGHDEMKAMVKGSEINEHHQDSIMIFLKHVEGAMASTVNFIYGHIKEEDK